MSRPQVIKQKDWWKEGFSAHDLVADSDLYFDTNMNPPGQMILSSITFCRDGE